MADQVKLQETFLHNGKGGIRVVKPGDMIDILPAEQRPRKTEDDLYYNKQHIEFLNRWLGNGPFQINRIGRWPCGKVMLYIKTNQGIVGSEPGVHAEDFT